MKYRIKGSLHTQQDEGLDELVAMLSHELLSTISTEDLMKIFNVRLEEVEDEVLYDLGI